jgi:hypothetical protein
MEEHSKPSPIGEDDPAYYYYLDEFDEVDINDVLRSLNA